MSLNLYNIIFNNSGNFEHVISLFHLRKIST